MISGFKGAETIRGLNDAVERRIFNPEQTEEIKSRMRVVGENIQGHTVIEAVFEDFELKEIFSAWTEYAAGTPSSPGTSASP